MSDIIETARKVLDSESVAPSPFEITHEPGVSFSTNGAGQFVAVMPDVAEEMAASSFGKSWMRRRRGIKGVGAGDELTPTKTVEWLVVELPGGVKLYQSENGVVITRADINP